MVFDWDTALTAIHAWTVAGSGLDAQKVVYGGQDTERPQAPSIILHIANISELGPTWVDYEPNPHTFADITVTADAGTNEFTATAHGRLTGDGAVKLETSGTFPGNTDGTTNYWVVTTGPNTFKLAASFQDAMAAVPVTIDLTSAGSGTIKLVDTAETQRQSQEMTAVARGLVRLTVELRCHADPVVGSAMAVALLQRVRARRDLPSQQAILEAANLSVQDVERVRSIVTGRRDDFLFEPRAHLDIHVVAAVEESEYLTIIERVTGVNEIKDPDENFAIPG